jgi:hypothetical protein
MSMHWRIMTATGRLALFLGSPGDLFRIVRRQAMQITITFWRDFERAL